MIGSSNSISGAITQPVERQLRAGGIKSADDLWLRAGDDLGAGLREVAEQTGIERDLLFGILADSITGTGPKQDPWLTRNATGMIVVLGLFGLALVILGIRLWLL
jgi:hypothetical protein